MHVYYPTHETGNILGGNLPANAPRPGAGGCNCGPQTMGLPGILGNSNVMIYVAIAFALGMILKK